MKRNNFLKIITLGFFLVISEHSIASKLGNLVEGISGTVNSTPCTGNPVAGSTCGSSNSGATCYCAQAGSCGSCSGTLCANCP